MDIQEYANRISNVSLDAKIQASKKMGAKIESLPDSDRDKKLLQGVFAWLTMNILIGNELSGPENVMDHVKNHIK